MINLLSTTSCHLCFGVEPLPNIRDGILVERLVIRRCPLDRGAPTNRRSQAPHFGNRPEQRSCTSSLASVPRRQIPLSVNRAFGPCVISRRDGRLATSRPIDR